ncbi:hypothetical protein BDZ97DRAFT_1920988 [Flammula alnicola]|nr:hypothetical protein BDZ97DRAFT_1920988 [Flammula alnicola]
MPELNAVPSLSHDLVSLDVWTSPVVSPVHLNVARGLFKLFPTIRDLQYDTMGPYAQLWRRAEEIIPSLHPSPRKRLGMERRSQGETETNQTPPFAAPMLPVTYNGRPLPLHRGS